MKKTSLIKLLTWIARILGIIFTAFITFFAIDVFLEGYSVIETLIALFMHLIPTFFLLIALSFGWKSEIWGGVLFMLLFIATIIFFHTLEHATGFLLISLPTLIISILFFVVWKLKK